VIALAVATQRPDASVAVLLVDVADMSTLHARLGFEASTAFLRGLTNAFTQVLAARGTIVCLGDGRYCIIISAVRNRGHAVLAGEKLLRVADDLVAAAELAFKPQISIGIALHPSQTSEPPMLLRYAQLAAAAARSQLMRLQVYDEACADRVLKSWELSDAFAKALDNGELSVFYQPKVGIIGERVAGVEALSRWLRDGKIVASPDAFIPLAEEAGLIHIATWYVLSNALRLAAECGGLPVAVNISPRMLHHP
jgi:predicted signal transduction protein with EAL and GGDEF domain